MVTRWTRSGSLGALDSGLVALRQPGHVSRLQEVSSSSPKCQLESRKIFALLPTLWRPCGRSPRGPPMRSAITLIGSIDPYALKIPARRAERSFTRLHPEVATRRHSALAAWPPWSRQNGAIGHRLQHVPGSAVVIAAHTSASNFGGAAKCLRVGDFDLARLRLGRLRAALADAQFSCTTTRWSFFKRHPRRFGLCSVRWPPAGSPCFCDELGKHFVDSGEYPQNT